ncbi:MAG: adenylyl-sulfate kinase [Gammaproteobacteria bacterium]|nr:adenylyl-sulfate kinase [Gammaproteobacteria bacterium]
MSVIKSSNVVWHNTEITKEKRNTLNKQRSAILWFTGLSGSGKSTVANALEHRLHKLNARTYILDGDNVRHGLNNDLGFGDDDRKENIRRIGEVSKLFIDAGVMVLTSFISPFREDRESVREIVNETEFIEVYIKCPLEVCEERDVKGLYAKARKGEIKHFTGIDSAYEEPENPEIEIDTSKLSIDQSIDRIINYLEEHSYIEVNRRKRLSKALFGLRPQTDSI